MDSSATLEAVKRPVKLCAFVLVLLVLAGCNRKSKADQLAALDRANKAGILTEDEYEAKRAAIEGPAPSAVPEPPAAAPLSPAIPPRDQPIAAASPAPEPIPAQDHPIGAAAPLQQGAPPPKQEVDEPEPTPSQGCDDAEYKSKKKGPQARFFAKPEAQVKKAALAALATLDFTVHKESGNDIEASKKRHASVIIGAGGERELLHFESAQEGGKRGTRVTGETKKSIVGRLAQKSWTAAVLAQIACNLK
jgi:hypothetical protein